MFVSQKSSGLSHAVLKINWSGLHDHDPELFEESDFYGTVEYITALKTGAGERGGFLFPQIYDGESCVAWGCFQEIQLIGDELDELGRILSSDSSIALTAEAVLKKALRFGTGKSGLRILIAGNCQVSGPYGMFFRKGLPEEIKTEIWKVCMDSLEKEFDPFHFVLIKDIPVQENQSESLFPKLGFREIPVLPVMKLELQSTWLNMDNYLSSMSSKYRIRAKAAIKKGAELVRELWDADKIKEHLTEIEHLYNQVYEKARFRLFRLNRSYFYELKKQLGEKLEFKAYYLRGNLVGFTTFIHGQNKADAHLIGMDYEANKSYSLYQNMLYDYVESAIRVNAHWLDLGRTAMEIKSTVGAIPFNIRVYIKLKNSIFNSIACLMLENAQPRPWIQRHPFKHD